jgi:hypothetical protein
VDLEDKLIFGLTPVRFGYLAVGALAAYVLAGHASVAGVVRMPVAALLLAGAAAFAWLRWRGRPLDAWLLDVAVFARRNLELSFDEAQLRRPALSRRRPRVPTITVLGDRPGAGTTTVAVELATALALKGRRVALTQVDTNRDAAGRLGLTGPGSHPRSGLSLVDGESAAAAECVVIDLGMRARHRPADLALVVAGRGLAGGDVRRRVRRAAHVAVVVNRDREPSGVDVPSPDVAAIVPEDPAIQAAQESCAPVILQFPASRAAHVFRQLAEQVDPNTPPEWDSDRPRAG